MDLLNELGAGEWVSLAGAGVLVLLLVGLGLVVVKLIADRMLRMMRKIEDLGEEREQQLSTLVHTFRWATNIAILIMALLMLLGRFGVPITPLLTGAGVAGLAISLGAQTLIKDLIGGFLIVVENQYAVGDVIEVQHVSGVVEKLTLRATSLRDLAGRLHVVPNGEVRIVSNVTKQWSRALIEVGVAYEEDLDRVLRVMEEIGRRLVEDPEVGPQLIGEPEVSGPISLDDWAITMRLMAKTQPGKHWDVGREIQKRILTTFEREGISMPYPRQEMWIRSQGFE